MNCAAWGLVISLLGSFALLFEIAIDDVLDEVANQLGAAWTGAGASWMDQLRWRWIYEPLLHFFQGPSGIQPSESQANQTRRRKQLTFLAVLLLSLGCALQFVGLRATPEARVAAERIAVANPRHMPLSGYRSVPIPVDTYGLNFFRPGDRIDILVIFPDKKKGEKSAQTILQNVQILDIQAIPFIKGAGILHVALNPSEAQYAILAAEEKTLHFTLRSSQDGESRPWGIVSLRKLFP